MKIKQLIILAIAILSISTFIDAKASNKHMDIDINNSTEQMKQEDNLILV